MTEESSEEPSVDSKSTGLEKEKSGSEEENSKSRQGKSKDEMTGKVTYKMIDEEMELQRVYQKVAGMKQRQNPKCWRP